MTKRDRITTKAKELLSSKPEGLRRFQLIAALERAFPGESSENLAGTIWNLDTRFPDEIYKASRGLFRSTKFRSREETQAVLAAKDDSQITWEDFDDTIKDIGSRFRHLERADVFVMWFLLAHIIDDEDQAATALVGGPNDKGIDAICIDESAKAIFIVQGKCRETLAEVDEERNDVLGLLEVARHLKEKDDQKFNSYLDGMDTRESALLMDARKRFSKESYRVLLYFVTLGKVSDTIRTDKELLDDLSRVVTMEIHDATSAEVLMRNYLDGVVPSIPSCSLEIERSNEVTVNNISQRYDEKNKIECWVLSMRGDKIAQLFENANTRLFARNVRGYLGQRSPVNEAMKETLQGQPDRFFYYNNGITILCDEAEKKSHEGRDELYVRQPQIINGQQTTRILAKYPDLAANASVLVKVISVKQRSSEDKQFHNLLSSIVAGTNWQSPIKHSDLRANDRIQVALERSLRKLGYGYIRKRQAPSEEKVQVGGKQYHRIKKEDFAQAVAACEIDGYVAQSSKEKLFDEERYNKLFESHDPFFYLARYWLMRQVNAALPSKNKRREARWLVVSFVWSKLAPFLNGAGPLRAFAEQCECSESGEEFAVSLTTIIDDVARAAVSFFQETKGSKSGGNVDMPTFFKSDRSSLKKFVTYLKGSDNELAGFNKQITLLVKAIMR